MPRKPRFHGVELGPIGRVGIVYDANGRAKPRVFKKVKGSFGAGRTKSGRRIAFKTSTANTALTTIDSTYGTGYSLTMIPAAAGDLDGRNTNDLNFLTYQFNGVLDWGATGTIATRVRVIVARIVDSSTPISALTIDAGGIYGRRNPDLKHVYFDKTFVYNGVNRYKKVKFTVPLKGAHIHYADATDTGQDRDDIAIYAVTPEGTPVTRFYGQEKIKWVE